ncbi:hypothetical protein RB653_003544 [Dictyostelium firmibasis]|uniref:WD40 repeat-containing protein n=1 Tax=Dictyostelium firmibasis TaxID=79012 RepID=A0AAN7U4S1_9MYCE
MPVSKKLKVNTTVTVPTKKPIEPVVEKTHKQSKEPKATTTPIKSTTTTTTTTTTASSKKQTNTKESLQPIIKAPNSTKVHHCSFSSWLPKPITSISYNQENNLIAVSRQESPIEIWVKNDQELILLKTLGGSKFDLPIISTVWLKKTVLLSVFENKFVIWDISSYSIIQELNSIGNVKGVSFNRLLNLLAVCTNDSIVRLYNFKFDESEIEYQSSFPSISDSKINTIQWALDQKTLLVGCSNQLVIFKVDSQRSSLNITTDNIVSLNSLNNDSAVCGFTNGFISIIDIKFGSIIQDFRNLHAPIRSIQVNKNGDQFFAAGDEATVISYNKSNNNKWAFSGLHRRDSHDIKCLEITNTHLISGGNSTQMIFYDLSNFTSLSNTTNGPTPNYFRIKSLPLPNTISITSSITSSQNQILLIESSRYQINIWQLGSTNENSDDSLDLPNGTHLNLSKKTKKLLQFESKNSQIIDNVDISNNGEYFCFSTRLETKLYSIQKKQENSDSGIIIKKIELPEDVQSSNIAKFSKDSKTLILAKNCDEIYQLNLESNQVNIVYKKEEEKKSNNIGSMEIDNNNNSLAIIDSMNQVLVYKINNNNGKETPTKLPNLNSIPTKLFFTTTSTSSLYIGTIDSVLLFDTKSLKIKSTKKLQGNRSVKLITENPNNSEELLIWSQNDQFKVNKDLSNDHQLTKAGCSFTEVIFASQSGKKGDLVLLDLSFIDKVLPNLPEAIKLKKFGGSN